MVEWPFHSAWKPFNPFSHSNSAQIKINAQNALAVVESRLLDISKPHVQAAATIEAADNNRTLICLCLNICGCDSSFSLGFTLCDFRLNCCDHNHKLWYSFFPLLAHLTRFWPCFPCHARYYKSLIIAGRHTKRINIPRASTFRLSPLFGVLLLHFPLPHIFLATLNKLLNKNAVIIF